MKETRAITWVCSVAFGLFAGLLVLSIAKLEWLQFLLFTGALLSLIMAGIGAVELIEDRWKYWRW